MSAKPKVPAIEWGPIDPNHNTFAARFGQGHLIRYHGSDGMAMVYVPDAQAFPDVVFTGGQPDPDYRPPKFKVCPLCARAILPTEETWDSEDYGLTHWTCATKENGPREVTP